MDFRNVVAKMLGLDVNTLAVADYEIIARIERIISAFNTTGILPVNIQRVQTPTLPAHGPNSNMNYEFISSQYDSNSSSHHGNHYGGGRERSASPHRGHHHHTHHSHSNSHHGHQNGHGHRSKSPRKAVTIIDPNSY